MSRKRIYLAGPVSMVGPPTYNRPAFAAAEGRLLTAGYRPVNPLDIAPPGMAWAEAMKRDIAELVKCDGVAVLPRFTESEGAKLEVDLAKKLSIPVDTVDGWIDEAKNTARVGSEEANIDWLTKQQVAAVTDPFYPYALPPEEKEEVVKAISEPIFKNIRFEGKATDVWTHDDEAPQQGELDTLLDEGFSVIKDDDSVALEAHRLVNGQRQDDYGHPLDNFTQTGKLWAAILGIPEITAEQVGLLMIAAKVSRQTQKEKRDNLTDIAGYAECVDKVQSERKRRAA